MDGAPPQRDPLALDKEARRQLGYRTVDLLVEWLERESPAIRRASPAEMRERLAGPPPEQAEPFEAILDGLERDVLPFASRDGHPPLGAPALEGLARALVELQAPAATAVVREGEPGDRFYVVADGELRVSSQGHELRTIGRGEGFGEIALLENVPRTATMTARTDSRLYALDKPSFLASVSSHPRAAGEANRLVRERLPSKQATIAP